jgi:DNA-binding transcriptional MerR regulator
VAYPTELTAALSGATVRQLAYWRRSNAAGERLLVPELRQAGRPLLYSFRDVIALRTFVYLRGEHSLQKVRKAVSTLRDLGNREHLAAYYPGVTADAALDAASFADEVAGIAS